MNPLDRLPVDKARHVIAGVLLGAVAAVAAILYERPELAGYAAVALAAIGGLGKEIADAFTNKKATGKWLGEPRGQPHGVEGLDFLATLFGGVLVGVPVFLLMKG